MNDLHVWFRSFRVKLSRMRKLCTHHKEKSSAGFAGKFSEPAERGRPLCTRRDFRFSESADRGLSNPELAVSSGIEGQRLGGGKEGRGHP